MAAADASNPELLRHYEGLVYRTAQLITPLVEDDFDDVAQQLRIKVWKALEAWDPARAPKLVKKYGVDKARDRSVFAWVKNYVKDLVKRKRRDELYIEDEDRSRGQTGGEPATDLFYERYLSASAEDTYASIDGELPLIPSTLTPAELRVVCLLYSDYRQAEVASYLSISQRDVERHVRAIKTKMSDWRPSVEVPSPLRNGHVRGAVPHGAGRQLSGA